MLIRNLNAAHGLCNGTGLQVYRLSNNCIHATILTGTDKVLPFKLRRRQFPVQIAFAMTINKAQGQSVLHSGFTLLSQCSPMDRYTTSRLLSSSAMMATPTQRISSTPSFCSSMHVCIHIRSTLKWVY
ncbi:TPA: hypothetical protein N0F65_004292 [Lagenidium giganteum]|uniref:DNA helicase Pif1-like 2B domain-containing protein n=1 Tax=Lagenidium giganteum TaxID=4803 RepID=A0AAV2ZGZ4_9STRA|nr:TPA: hypothetical protein N0F65_004292 [Lagenidium giganteum]